MKINPIGIQSYQQLNRQNQPPATVAEDAVEKAQEQKVTVEPGDVSKKSALAVKAPQGNYDQFLSTEERQALDMLFARFRDGSRFGGDVETDEASRPEENSLGQLIDVKV